MIPEAGRILGIDWGEVRIGLALSDETQTLASPLATLARRPGKRLPIGRLLELTDQHQPAGIVVGLPLAADGSETESAASARELATRMAEHTRLPLELWDERMSTARVLSAIREQGGSIRGRKGDVDAHAAAVLLQHFLDARRNRSEKSEREEGEEP
jgi:putative Holliday junction resolvase